MYAKELKSANGRKPGKSKDTSTPHCIYNTDPFQVGPVSDTDMLSKMTIELPKFYKPPPIEDCVNDYNLPKSAELMKSVNAISERIVKESAADSLNRENVKCLSLYTFDPKPPSKGLIGTITGGGSSSNSNSSSKGDSEASARGRLNEMLRTRNPFMVVKNRGYLVSFLTALRKLPKTEKFAFYVGVREKIANASKFKYGSLVSCKFFLSSSTDPDSIKEMLDYTGTLFIIRGDPWAYDIRPFSFYPNEQEYLFEFGSQFKVTKVINGPINTIEMSINKTQNYDLTALVPIPGYVPPSPASSSSSSSSSSSLSSQQQVPSHTQSDLGNAQAQGAKSLAPMASVACLTPHSNVVVAPNVPNHHQQSPSAVTATPANQNTLVATNSVFKVQPKLIPKPSFDVRNATAVMSTRINDIVIKLRNQSRDSYLEGCDELNVLIFENNNPSTKEMCMSFKVIGPIFAALKAYPRDLSLCEVSFNTIYLLSDTAATQILQSGVIPTMAAITQGFINEASICTLWSGIFINLFTGDASFRAANLSATAANSNTGGNDSGFGLIRAIFAAHKAKDFQLCGILAGIVQSFAREGYFKDHLASVGAELVVGFLGVLNADPTLSHSICPAVMELLPCLGTGSLGQANYAILAKTAQLRAGFLDDLLPVLTVLRRAAERKDNVLTMGASALGLPRTIVGVMQNYAENSAVVEACLCLAARILEENTSLGNDFVQCGYVQCAAAAIRKHGATVPAICAGALDSLLIISMNSAGIQAITSVGVVPLLFELLKAPGVAASTVHAAWGIASWVASRDPTSARLVFTSSDNANIIFTLFDTYSRDPVATERCVGLLVYLAQCPEMRTAVAAPRVLSTLTSVLGSYINNSGVCGHVCNLLSIAADVLSDVSGLKSSISSLLSLVFKFHTDTSIVTYACSTLTKIALRDAAQHCSSFGDYSWASSLCGAIEKNSAAPDLCKPIFEALTVITRVPDVTNFRVLALYTQLFVFVLGKNASDLVIGQYVSSVLRNILNADNVVPTLMGLNDTIPAINAVLMANGTDRTIFVNCSAILQAIVSNKAVFLTFTQSGCANCFYSIYTSFSACAPDIAAEASWINQYIFH